VRTKTLPPSLVAWSLVSVAIGWLVFPGRFEWLTASIAATVVMWIGVPLVFARWVTRLSWKGFVLIAVSAGGAGTLLLYWKLRVFDVARSDAVRLEGQLLELRDAARETIEIIESTGAAGLLGMFVAGVLLGAVAGIASAAIFTRTWCRTRMRDDRAHDLLCLTGSLTAGFGVANLAITATPVWILMTRTANAMNAMGSTRDIVPRELVGEFLGFAFFAVVVGAVSALALWGAYLALRPAVQLIWK
jgi:hypothetical protein